MHISPLPTATYQLKAFTFRTKSFIHNHLLFTGIDLTVTENSRICKNLFHRNALLKLPQNTKYL